MPHATRGAAGNASTRLLARALGSPVLVNDGVLRIALTGFDKKEHDAILPELLARIDGMLSIGADDPILETFIDANPFYSYAKLQPEAEE